MAKGKHLKYKTLKRQALRAMASYAKKKAAEAAKKPANG